MTHQPSNLRETPIPLRLYPLWVRPLVGLFRLSVDHIDSSVGPVAYVLMVLSYVATIVFVVVVEAVAVELVAFSPVLVVLPIVWPLYVVGSLVRTFIRGAAWLDDYCDNYRPFVDPSTGRGHTHHA